MKLFLLLVFAVCCTTMLAQPVDNRIVTGMVDSIHSKVLNEKRKLWVFVPNNGPNDFYSIQKYPVIYLLDGDGHFHSLMGMVQYLSLETVYPQMIIAWIPNTNRLRDLTPTKPRPDKLITLPPFVDGGEAFTLFLETRPIVSFANTPETNNTNGLRWKFQYYPDDSHGSVPLIAEYDALRYLFSKYSTPVSMNYNIREPSFNADSAIIAHFKSASREMGYTVLPPENFVNKNAYAKMRNNGMERAFRLFDLNIRNYPYSYNVYGSMGDYYMSLDDNANAIAYFTNAQEREDVPMKRQKPEAVKTMK